MTAVPEGRFRTENCCVPAGAKVAVAGLTLGGSELDAVKVTVAVPSTAYVTGFVAIGVTAKIVALSCEGTVLGAVKTPVAEMVPTG